MIGLAMLVLAQAAADTARHVRWEAFVDTYYAWDSGRPRTFDRPFTTQAARHNEFNVNLAYAAATLTSSRIRGRLALQAGTSVQANYAAEPAVGAVSGPALSRTIQEATAGYRVAPALWIDGGVYFSYIGLEGWISRDNPTYTRSFVADYTPYYLSGVHATWQPRPALTLQLHVMNGWQNVSENNSDKAVGVRVDWQATPSVLLAYADFFGNELPDSVTARTRVFHQIMGRVAGRGGVSVQGQVDVGSQAGSAWYGWCVIARRALGPALALAARLEQYHDPDQVIVVTGTGSPFRTAGGSVTVDVGRSDRALWRTEVRALRADAPLFPAHGQPQGARNSVLLVSSLALTL